MSYVSEILHMIIFIIIMLTSLNAAMHFNENHHVQKVSGEEENEGMVLDKFRALLGLQSFDTRQEEASYSHDSGYGSPLHSPDKAPAPAPAPVLYQHVHSHHRHSHRPRISIPQRRRIDKKKKSDQGLLTTNVVLFIVSASVIFVLLGSVLIWGCKKFKKIRKETNVMAIMHRSDVENNSRLKGVGIIEKGSNEMVRSESRSVRCSAVGDIVSDNKIENSSVGCSSHIREAQSDDNEQLAPSETSETEFPSNLPMASSFLSSVQPPPPPPPPPLKRIHMIPSTSPSETITLAALSSAFSNFTVTSNGDHYSESNQNPQSYNTPQPLPPPFTKAPPPPSPLEKYRSLDKDGNQLPKLKPLHWDKVRTAPDHSMVWDKIRASSFE